MFEGYIFGGVESKVKRQKRIKFISIFSLFLILLLVLSGCTGEVIFSGNLNDGEQFYLQNVDGSTTVTEMNNLEAPVTVDSLTTIGGFIETPVEETSVYWVPRYDTSLFYEEYYLQTDVGRPTKTPDTASINNLIMNPMDPNKIVIVVNVLDQNAQNVDGNTHILVRETAAKHNINFLDFDHAYELFILEAAAEEPPTPDPLEEGWKMSDSTSTIFGQYKIDTSFFEKVQTSNGNIGVLLDNLEPAASPQDGVVAILSKINEDVWNEGSFSLDLATGTDQFTTLNVPLPKLNTTLPETGTVELQWPTVFGDDVVGYRIYQDNQNIAEVDSNTTSFVVNNLTVGSTPLFSVRAILNNNGDPIESVLSLSASQPVVDVEAPLITLNGDNPIIIGKGKTFADPGVTATDDVDGDITDKVTVTGQIDVNTLGEYQIVYAVSDLAGNQAEVSRTVKVVDKTIPVITILGDNPLTIEQGSVFTDPGVSVTDDVDGDLTEKVNITGKVDVNTTGEYTLVYSVSDAAGNLAEATRTVKVKAKVNTVIPIQNSVDQNQSIPLAETATNQYNMILVGIVITLLGGFLLLKLTRRA